MANERDYLELATTPPQPGTLDAVDDETLAVDRSRRLFNDELRRRVAEQAIDVDLEAELAALCAELEASASDDDVSVGKNP